ncbi:MAG TPA: hypothetical protein VMN56_08140 [Casimicrobiaceae bacterium]|nr:hypothetical protein [Casimicrobiaceae bacterium]
MDALALLVAALLPWWLGVALLLVLRRRLADRPGAAAWTIGAGYLAGAFLLTVWMRVVSLAGVAFSVWIVALPLAAVAAALTAIVWKRNRSEPRTRDLGLDLDGASRVLFYVMLAWIALRFAMLGIEMLSRPLYPWDAWTQWATKARVWYELGRIAPFVRQDAWLAAQGAAYFDASPEYPPTMPLLQVWSCLVLGRWDDTLMNGPWWCIGVALTLTVYGGLRSLRAGALASMVGAFLVASLPLANVHVALAGYADLPMAAYYTTAALALLRWIDRRALSDVACALLLAVACTQVKNPGWFWAATLVPGFIVARWPRHGVRIAFAGFALALLVLVALARFKFRIFNYDLALNYAPAWTDLAESYFLLGNWHVLWYGAIAAALLAWRSLLSPALAPLTTIVAGGLIFLFVVFGFTTASFYISDQTTVNRATLHLAPLVVVFTVLAWQAFARRWSAAHAQAPATAG